MMGSASIHEIKLLKPLDALSVAQRNSLPHKKVPFCAEQL